MIQECRKRTGWMIPYILIGALFGVAFTTGYSPAASQPAASSEIDYGQQLNEIIQNLQENHVNPDSVKSKDELFGIAIDAIMKQIGDKHGSYFTPEALSDLQEQFNPHGYGGIGISLTAEERGLVILDIFDNSPIKDTSIRPGDVITGAASLGEPLVEWKSTTPNMNELISAIKGPAGTDVTLRILRDGDYYGEFTVQRITARMQTVYMKLSDTGILTIRLTQFTAVVSRDIYAALREHGWMTEEKLNTEIVKGLVLDLRNNPGGILGSAIAVNDMFMPKDTIAVRVVERAQEPGGPRQAIDYAVPHDRLFPNTIPRVILINGNSASASEIVSGGVKQHHEGLIMGVKSYGKGSVQSVIPLSGGGAIKTTTAIYLAGGAMEIDGIGVTPDAEVLQPRTIGTSEEAQAFNSHLIRTSMDPEIDHQLHVAHTYINYFISGEHDFSNEMERRTALNRAHGADTTINGRLCNEKGLRGCPPDNLSLLENTDAAGWIMYSDDYDSEMASLLCGGPARVWEDWGWTCTTDTVE